MSVDRRQFLEMLGLMGAAAPWAAAQAPETGGEALTYEEVLEAMKDAKLFFVPYSHNDYSWFATETWHHERAARIERHAVEILHREDNFKWFIDVKLERMDRIEKIHPELIDDLKKFVAEGRVGVAAGTVVNNDNPFNEAEAIIRNMVLGRKYFRKHFPDVNLDVAAFIDIHPGCAQMPQLLTKAGYKYYRFTRPIFPLDRKGYKREFIWEGLDGSEMLLSYGPYGWMAGGWGMGKGAAAYYDEISGYKDDWERAVVAIYDSAVRSLSANSPSNVIWIPVGLDHTLPLSIPRLVADQGKEGYLDLPGFVREWAKRESIPLDFATPLDFYRELEKQRSTLPRVKGVIEPVGWPFWYGQCGSLGLDNWRDRSALGLVEAEIFSSMASWLGADYPEEDLEALWYDGLFLFPHDGLYISDEDLSDGIRVGGHVVYECGELRQRAMTMLSHRIAADPDEQKVAIVNPLNWTRREVIELKAVFPEPGVSKIKVVDGQGRQRPHQVMKMRGYLNPGEHLFTGRNSYKELWLLVDVEAPPTGYTTLTVVPQEGSEIPEEIEESKNVIESDFARIELGPLGVNRIVDKTRGAVYEGAGNPIFYTNDDPWPWHGGPVTSEQKIRGAKWKIAEEGPLLTRARMTGMIGDHEIAMTLSVYPALERVDFSVDIDSVGGNGYFAANVVFDYDAIPYAGVPFGAEHRDLSNEPWADGSDVNEEFLRKNVFYAHHWVDHSDGKKGLTLLAAEGKRGFLYHPEERSLEHILMLTIVKRPIQEDFTNRYFTGEGRHHFDYSLLLHDGDWKQGRSVQRAQEKLYPLRETRVHSQEGADLPAEKSFVTVSPETVAMSSCQGRDGGFDLRLYDSTGDGAEVEVGLPFAPSSCRAVDFNGNELPGPEIALRGDRVRFKIKPWEIVTLRFGRG